MTCENVKPGVGGLVMDDISNPLQVSFRAANCQAAEPSDLLEMLERVRLLTADDRAYYSNVRSRLEEWEAARE